MEWVSTKDRLPEKEDARDVLNCSGDTIWKHQVMATTHGGLVLFDAFTAVGQHKHSAWCQIPDAYVPKKAWRKPTLDDLKNGPVPCRAGEHRGGWHERELCAIDVNSRTSRPYLMTNNTWHEACEIEVDDE